jgi:hypothetical protein
MGTWLVDFLYSHPTWEVGLIIIGLWTGLSLAGLYLFHRCVPVEKRLKDNETVGLTYAIVAVVYAVLIAFIVVDVFEAESKADEIATAEANYLNNVILDSSGLSPAVAAEVKADVGRYIDLVVKSEWPSQQAGKLSDQIYAPGWAILGRISVTLAAFEPATSGQNVNKGELLSTVNQIMKARRNRIIAARDHLPDVVWQILIASGVIAVGYTYLFGAHSFAIHLASTGMIAATISLIFVLIIALDYPFRGEVSVSDEAYLSVKSMLSRSGQPELGR